MRFPLKSVGRSVQAILKLRGDKNIVLNTGQVYIYDGIDATGSVIGSLNGTWKTFVVEKPIVGGSQFVEVWVRLVIGDGTGIPSEGDMEFTVELTLN